MRRAPVISLVLLVALGGAAQLVPVQRTNPPVAAPLRAPAEIEAIVARSCADCHTNETHWPWYAYVAPASWLITRDVRVGRDNLDFSYWGQLPAADQRQLAKSIARQVAAGTMPLRPYRILHPKARLSPSDVQRLREWFSSREATPGPVIDSVLSENLNGLPPCKLCVRLCRLIAS
jgi:mono/diheme cytochrome c family protein